MSNSTFLPSRYQFIHEYCLYLHDYLAEFIIFGEETRSFDVSIQFSDYDEADSFGGLVGEEIWDWLETKGYSSELGDLLLKSLFPALLSDFCQFTYEALSCSDRARLTVAYSLMRKPLKENLAYLEWLLGDPEKLLNTLYNEPATSLALHLLTQRHRLLPTMKTAISRLAYGEMYDPDTLYDLRYEKAAEHGFEMLWNKAVHLVTTHRELSTEPRNLNFIFSDNEARATQWDFLYTRLPLLLHYTAEICESIMVLIRGDLMPNAKERIIHRSFGWMACVGEIAGLSESEAVNDADLSVTENHEIGFPCPRCGSNLAVGTQVHKSLFQRGKAKCEHCRSRLRLSDFVNDDA